MADYGKSVAHCAGTADPDQHLHTVGQRLGRLATGKNDIGDNDGDHLDPFVLSLEKGGNYI